MSISQLASRDLGLTPKDVERIANSSEHMYRHFKVGDRLIDAPLVELKMVQTWVADLLKIEFPVNTQVATAYEIGSNIVENAEIHAGDSHFLTMDIRGFFRSCTTNMVVQALHGMTLSRRPDIFRYSIDENDITLLSKLVCYRDSLPTGAPSSPLLANRIMIPVDNAITAALPTEYHYSRYSDDICVSSREWMQLELIIGLVESVLGKYGFTLNVKKTKCRGRGNRCRITGVVITPTGELSIGRERKTKLKSDIYKFLTGNSIIDPLVLLGHMNFCKQVDPGYFNRLVAKYSGCGVAREFGGVIPAIYASAGLEKIER